MTNKAFSINPEEYNFPTPSTIKMASRLMLLLFLIGIGCNIYMFLFGEWKWDWKLLTLFGFDGLTLLYLFAFSIRGMLQNNLPALYGVIPADGRKPECFPHYDRIRELGCEFAGTIVLGYGSMSSHEEIYPSRDGAWIFIRSLTDGPDQKVLKYRAFSLLSPCGSIGVKNDTAPPYILPPPQEDFVASLVAADPNEIIALHCSLLEDAKRHRIEPKQMDFFQIPNMILEVVRINCDFQCAKGLVRKKSPDDYRLTLYGSMMVSIRAWYFLAFQMGKRLTKEDWIRRLHERFNRSPHMRRVIDY